jgi:glycosyltransferase involved in cell wall biosynthesis
MVKKVSIVIPIYNVDGFLERCLTSVKEQNYTSFEVLLIDDGSTDNSSKICNEFVKNDDRFIYIYQKNSGVSAARNNGIREAHGDYITFVDGDDFLEESHIEKMVNGFLKAELVISGRKNITEKGVQEVFQSNEELFFNRENLVKQILKLGIVYSFPWNKMYIKKFLDENSLYFDESLDYGEDLVFNIQYALLIHKSVLITDSTYNYVYRESSASNHMNEDSLRKRVTDLLSVKKTIQILPSNFIKEKNFLSKRIVVEGARYIRLMYVYNFSTADINFYKKMVENSYKLIKSSLSNREKIVYYGNLKIPKTMNFISKLKNIIN